MINSQLLTHYYVGYLKNITSTDILLTGIHLKKDCCLLLVHTAHTVDKVKSMYQTLQNISWFEASNIPGLGQYSFVQVI